MHAVVDLAWWEQADLLDAWRVALHGKDAAGWWCVIDDPDMDEGSRGLAREQLAALGLRDRPDGGARVERARSSDPMEAAREIAKYVTKAFDDGERKQGVRHAASLEEMTDDELAELMQWLRGRRLLRTYGTMYDAKLEAEPEDEEGDNDDVRINAVTGEVVPPERIVQVADADMTPWQWGWVMELFDAARAEEKRGTQ
jgi:hypothetical protein